MQEAITDVWRFGDTLMAEEYMNGVEITMPILGNDELTVLPLIEITYERSFNDYTTKYTSGLHSHIIPACIDKTTEQSILSLGQQAYKVLGCCGLSRVDFIVDHFKGPMIIEANTLPGMTDISLFPDAARYMGMGYDDLVERILDLGYETTRMLQ
jgi:D-alanine-D-alanine ligase